MWHPGTFSKGFAAVTNTANGIYLAGMMCSDIEFPRSGQEQYTRYFGQSVSFKFHLVSSEYQRYHGGWPKFLAAWRSSIYATEFA